MTDKALAPVTIKPDAIVQPTVSVADSTVIGSGTIVTMSAVGLTIGIADLTYEIVFEDKADTHNVQMEKTGDKSMRIRLFQFNNALGTSIHFVRIGDVANKPLWLSLYVEAVGEDVRVVSYTVYWGGEFG